MHYEQIAAMFAKGKKLFAAGQNVVNGLSADEDTRRLAIEISYSLQSGSYTDYSKSDFAAAIREEGHRMIEPILRDHNVGSILDCGTGEGTRWFGFNYPTQRMYCLDASFHRLVYCKRNLREIDAIANASVIKGNMVKLPFAEASVDAVFTCHSIEPNTDRDASCIIEQIFGIARKLVVIMEPNYRDAEPEMKARMEAHGYARNIWDVALNQPDYDIIDQGSFENVPNPLNRTSYIVARRRRVPQLQDILVSPIDGIPLTRHESAWIDGNSCMAFPIFNGIHCLAPEDAVFVGCNPAQ
ncbi:MAG: class I SAM-dependent methyltransferase [Hyphomicrobiales bacterium]|nr:class I SAM-dependent methyltransferase [Hyphomicrobiales bacterium]